VACGVRTVALWPCSRAMGRRNAQEPESHPASVLAGVRHPETKKRPAPVGAGLFEWCSGGDLLSHEASLAVPSARRGLTSGFGMGPGVSLSLWPPGTLSSYQPGPLFPLRAGAWFPAVTWEPHSERVAISSEMKIVVSQALGLLVPVS
jgi:hypothetical protein